MSCSVVILAAGQGKRMQSDKSKVLHTLAGRPFIQHVIEKTNEISSVQRIIVYGHLGEQLKEELTSSDITWAEQNPPQGTGHAVQQALPYLPSAGTTLILYGDVPLIQSSTLRALVENAAQKKLALLALKTAMPDGYGRIVRDTISGKVIEIVEQKDASFEQLKIDEVNTGIMAVPTEWLHEFLPKLTNKNAQNEYYLTDLIAMVSKKYQAIDILYPQYEWEVSGVNDRIQQADLERNYQLFQANQLMKQGVSLKDPARFDLRGTLICGRDVEIDVNCVFEGHVTLESGVKIASHCVIRNAHIKKNSIIESFSYIDESHVGESSKIGPFARLRPGTHLDSDVHIGNFVEIKNSHIGAKSKVNHLSYIGDADLGERINVGAGTITCNYDGVNKFRTTIGDNVFIGSGTLLVAPVQVATLVTIAAGTTVWKNVNETNSLVLNKKEQVIRSNWLRPVKKEGK